MNIIDARGMTLSGADQEIISAEVTYGGAGTCQSATVRPVNTSVEGRAVEWHLTLSGTGAVFRGIPDAISDADGQLAQVGLMPPHRPRLGGLGERLAQVQAGAFETLSDALQRELGHLPDADIGIRPDGTEVAEVPTGGPDMTAYAYNVRYIGPSYPDAVTDAVFDPGEGWRKYAYKREVPPYALRRTAQARADPPIIQKRESLAVKRSEEVVAPIVENGVTHSFNNVIELDGVERTYAESDSTADEIKSDVGIVVFQTGVNTDERRNKRLRIRCPFLLSRITAYPQVAPVILVPSSSSSDAPIFTSTPTNEELAQRLDIVEDRVTRTQRAVEGVDASTRTPRGTPKRGEPKLLISLLATGPDGRDSVLATTMHTLKEQDVGLDLSIMYELDTVVELAQMKLRYELVEQDTGRAVTLTFRPAEVVVEYDTPNVEAVKMPEGWEKPFATAGRHEFRLPGWHIPPFTAFGQQVASATVTWNKDDCSTLCTTGALGYG